MRRLLALLLCIVAATPASATEVGPLYVGDPPAVVEVVIELVDQATGQTAGALRCGMTAQFTFNGFAVPNAETHSAQQVTTHIDCAPSRGGSVTPSRLCALARLQNRYPTVNPVYGDTQRMERCTSHGTPADAATPVEECFPCKGWEYRGVGDFSIEVPEGYATRQNGSCVVVNARTVNCRLITGSVYYR